VIRVLLLALVASSSVVAQTTNVVHDREFTDFFRQTSGWTAGDGALSIPLSGGQVLWLFGDSHVDDIEPKNGTMPCLFQVRNAGFLQLRTNDLTNPKTLIGSGPGFRSWFKSGKTEDQWFWPICGFRQAENVYIYLATLRKTAAGGMWGFESIGHDFFAKLSVADLEKAARTAGDKPLVDAVRISYLPLPAFNGIGFGNGFVRDGDYVLAYGQKQSGIAGDLYLARFRAIKPDKDWQFWDGLRWNDNVNNAVIIGRGASTSIHVCKVRDRYVVTSSAFSVACDQGRDIFMSVSDRPTGTFSARHKVFTVDDEYQGHYPFFYFPVAHPEFINDQDEILVTYSINGYQPCVSACIDGRAIPDHYRPRAIRVPLGMIGIGK